ncbi:MAG TPA: hypothetical protein DCY82_00575 [Acidimicrobiaceae bacterium]|nr:hypothetical protein [Acidimicrobiaceae bacterium]
MRWSSPQTVKLRPFVTAVSIAAITEDESSDCGQFLRADFNGDTTGVQYIFKIDDGAVADIC